MEVHDYIVVGSGCTGAMAAQTLVEAGVRVTMLDAAVGTNPYRAIIPEKSYLDIRRTEPEQYRYFIGNNAEGITWGKSRVGENLTPPRKYVIERTDVLIPFESHNFFPMESLAAGGLGNAWGLGCCQFSNAELIAAGLHPDLMAKAYETVAGRIGISGARDDTARYTLGGLQNFLPAPEMDSIQSSLFTKYNKHKDRLNRKGFYMGRTALALLTQDMGERRKHAYHDMDFYADHNQSVYRPTLTLEQLRRKSNFNYIASMLVTHIVEKGDNTEVHCLHIMTGLRHSFLCRKLILASGVLGTARILLRSFAGMEKLPVLSNPYSYIPCIQWSQVGKAAEKKKLGFSQLSLFHDPTGTNFDVSMASIYSYQSLMLFRIIKHAPLNFIDARVIMRYLQSGLLIMGIHHPDRPYGSKYLRLVPDSQSITGYHLKADCIVTEDQIISIREIERKYIRAMRLMGTSAITRIDPGYGSSIHYAGSLPFDTGNKAFHLLPNGRLGATRNIFIADGSGFTYLPAKGLTFSLMANAHLVAQNALRNE